jgi:rhamnose transport system permease protein
MLGQERLAGLPTQVWIFGIATLAAWVFVHRTTFGRSFRAIGFAPEGARYAGLPVGRRTALVYVLAGLVAGLAAVIYTSRLGQAKADAGTGYELLAITAVVLGGSSIFGGIGSIHGTLLGVAVIAVLKSGLVQLGQPSEVAGVLTGVLLIVALAANRVGEYVKALFQPKRQC